MKKLDKIDYSKLTYSVSGIKEFDLTTALRLWKAKFEDFKDFKKDVITHPQLEELGKLVEEMWDSIEPVTVSEALQNNNTEQRRVYFDCIGVEKLFKSLDPMLLDSQTITKKRYRWDDDNKEYQYEFKDVYELYEIDGKKMFTEKHSSFDSIYAVRCWCTTTNREYWIYVPPRIAIGNTWNNEEPDAIRAIAWTIRIDVANPKRIYRQGDIIVAKMKEDSKTVTPYHLNKEQYLSLMYSET